MKIVLFLLLLFVGGGYYYYSNVYSNNKKNVSRNNDDDNFNSTVTNSTNFNEDAILDDHVLNQDINLDKGVVVPSPTISDNISNSTIISFTNGTKFNDDDTGENSIAVKNYENAIGVILSNGTFILRYKEVSRKLSQDYNESEIYEKIESLFTGEYRLLITGITQLSDDSISIGFEIFALTYLNDIDDVEKAIKEDLDYVLNSGIIYDTIKTDTNGDSLELVLSSQWSIQNITTFQASRLVSLPEVFVIQPSYFYFLGDWGKGGLSGDITSKRKLPSENSNNNNNNNNNNKVSYTYQSSIARAMNSLSRIYPPQAILSLGDNIYPNGVTSTTDSLWNSLFREVYLSNSNLQGVKWHPVFGNHDYGSSAGVQAQIDRTFQSDDDEWTFPERNYTKKFKVSSSSSLYVVFIDTTTLCPSVTSATNSKGGISTSVQEARITDQLYHIEKNLKLILEEMNQREDWLFMVGHYPVFSQGEHGDTAENIQYLLPILENYPIHAYISGHDHISEHLQYTPGGTNYFIAGAGSMTSSLSSKASKAQLLWAGENYAAFLVTAITKYSCQFKFINYLSETTYTYTLTKSSFTYQRFQENYTSNRIIVTTTKSDVISCSILFILFLLVLFHYYYKCQGEKPSPSLLLLTESNKPSYIPIFKKDKILEC